MQAGIYCRISEDREGAGLGVQRQREDCEAIAQKRGWDVARVYVDNDISAYSGKPRPEYRKLMEDIESGFLQAVVVWHLDRLHRQPKELEAFIDLVERKQVSLASVSGEHDLATPEGRLTARIIGAVARAESEHKSRRIRRKKLEMAQSGRWSGGGGTRPYGYSDHCAEIIPEEAAVIREGMERLLAGESLRSLCFDFNSRGLRSVHGNLWNSRALSRILKSARIAGLIEHHTAGIVDGTWEAIITKKERARLLAFLNDPSRRTFAGGRPALTLLSGLLRCSHCGGPLVAGPPTRYKGEYKGASYHCSPRPDRGCGKTSVTARLVETYVVDGVLKLLSDPRLLSKPDAGKRVDQDIEAIAADRAMLDEIAAAYAGRKITMAEWLSARQPIEERISQATKRIADQSLDSGVRRLAGEPSEIRDRWPSFSVDQQRSLIKSVLDHVVVLPAVGGRFTPGRLAPVWRF
jgi:DNA invertase Pin-like site-specific DNA recombinase